MKQTKMQPDRYLCTTTDVFYSLDYLGYEKVGNPDFLNDLKNTFGNYSDAKLQAAIDQLEAVLSQALVELKTELGHKQTVLCVVPRAKAQGCYSARQLLFRAVVQHIAQQKGFVDGTEYVTRHTNTRTTHRRNHDYEGALPYPGITRDTCHLSGKIRGQHIILVDDVYTPTCGVDEDAVQALLNAGAASVTFYAVAKTLYRNARRLC